MIYNIYSAYLGIVSIDLESMIDAKGEVVLESTIGDLIPITVRTVDGRQFTREGIQDMVVIDTSGIVVGLGNLPAYTVNIQQAERNNRLVMDNSNEGTLEALRSNVAVDVHYIVCAFMDFMQKVMRVYSIGPQTDLRIAYGVQEYSGACFDGDGILYVGIGNIEHGLCGTLDMIGCTLVNYVLEGFYPGICHGESGAIRIHFSDMLLISFKNFMYNREQNHDLEDCFSQMVRSGVNQLDHPLNSESPRVYRGKHWVDLNSEFDHGGVHTNSSVANYCFFLLTRNLGLCTATKLFMGCLFRCPATYKEFSRELLAAAKECHVSKQICIECLDVCGLMPRSEMWRMCTVI